MITAWAYIVKSNARYQCQTCGSTELLQAHDPTGRHIDPNDGICLCAEHHSQEHPNMPKALFFSGNKQPYWSNLSASSLAVKLGVHPRTIIRASKRLEIPTGYLYDKDRQQITNSVKHCGRYNNNEPLVTFSIKIHTDLKDRIDILARKGLITRNRWITRTLTREAHLKPPSVDSRASNKGD